MNRKHDLDEAPDAALGVALVIQHIDESDDEQRDVLLADLLCAAWPSYTAQDQ